MTGPHSSGAAGSCFSGAAAVPSRTTDTGARPSGPSSRARFAGNGRGTCATEASPWGDPAAAQGLRPGAGPIGSGVVCGCVGARATGAGAWGKGETRRAESDGPMQTGGLCIGLARMRSGIGDLLGRLPAARLLASLQPTSAMEKRPRAEIGL